MASQNETKSKKFKEFIQPTDLSQTPKRDLSITTSDNSVNSSICQNRNKTQAIDNSKTQLENNARDMPIAKQSKLRNK